MAMNYDLKKINLLLSLVCFLKPLILQYNNKIQLKTDN